PIGGVMATNGVIIPNAVGVDIGCGMISLATDFKDDLDEGLIKEIIGKTREEIPVGFRHHDKQQEWDGWEDAPDIQIINQELKSATRQLGTLGRGNHFIEIQRSNDGYIWLMIHSGSRNIGLKIAKTYHDIAKQLCDTWFSDIPNKDLSFLPLDSNQGQEYIQAMLFALGFARENRRLMMQRFSGIVMEKLGCKFPSPLLDVHHNYARMENHFKQNVMLHRKGATSAKLGEAGIIPGSQGTKSYIVEGLGERESFESCSHGAGRKMGRKEAKRSLDLDEQKGSMEGVVHSVRTKDDLDEAPGAYKDIEMVMSSQTDLVKIVVELTPLGIMKG
ncbi:hypothetical protein LCGC14_2027380, partial [marine sediment metagenome]